MLPVGLFFKMTLYIHPTIPILAHHSCFTASLTHVRLVAKIPALVEKGKVQEFPYFAILHHVYICDIIIVFSG